MFWGGDATALPETKALFLKWRVFFDIFLQGVDRRTGSFIHLPFSGGTIEQPAKTMTILNIMQALFFERIKEQFKNK